MLNAHTGHTCLEPHLNKVACGHDLIAWRALGTYAAGNRLASFNDTGIEGLEVDA